MTATRIGSIVVAGLALAVGTVGCGGDEQAAPPLPVATAPLVTDDVAPVETAGVTTVPVVDVGVDGGGVDGGGAGDGVTGTNPLLTTSSIGEPPPPFSLSGAQATTPTIRAQATSTTGTTAAPSSTTATSGVTATTGPPATTAPAPPPPSGPVVEFRIRSGTQAGAWNSFENRVRLRVGQVLRIHNDDVVAHTVHTDGTPFEHGPTIQPGRYADHPVVRPYTPDRSAPAVYEHDAGRSAPFWVEVTAGPAPTTTAAPTTAQPTTAPPATNPPTTNRPTSSPPPTNPPTTAANGGGDTGRLAAAEAESLRLLNELRAGLGAGPVTASDQEMHRFARSWALEMRNTGFRHSDARWSENIVWYSDETMTPSEAAAQLHDMWVNSPGHYRNMTNPDWTVVGVGMWHDETGWWGVHVFR